MPNGPPISDLEAKLTPHQAIVNGTVTCRLVVKHLGPDANGVRLEVQFNRNKSSKNPANAVTTFEYGPLDNLVTKTTLPEGNTIENTYDDGVVRDVSGNSLFTLRSRVGFLLKETRKPGPRGGDQQLHGRGDGRGQAHVTLGPCLAASLLFLAAIATVFSAIGEDSVKIDLSQYGECAPDLEFSLDNKSICAWWASSEPGPARKDRGKAVVFSLSGQALPDAVNMDGTLKPPYSRLFPRHGWRSELLDFVKDSYGWGFSPDYSFGFRLIERDEKESLEPETWKAELWKLRPRPGLVWRVVLCSRHSIVETVEWLDWQGVPAILLGFSGTRSYILAQGSGAIIASVAYGETSTGFQSRGRFSASALSFERNHRLLACGEFRGKLIRVISIDQPEDIVFETRTTVTEADRRGFWSVRRVEFAGPHYLISETRFEGRGLPSALSVEATDIYDTRDWSAVWQENSLAISRVTLSPDGRWLAYYRRGVLEIMPFRENKTRDTK